MPDLIHALRNDVDADVRRIAVEVLGQVVATAQEAVPDLIRALRHDAAGTVRRRAAVVLRKMGETAALGEIPTGPEPDSDPAGRPDGT